MNPQCKCSALISAFIAAAIVGSYTLGRHHTETGIAAAAERTPLYYQDPSGKPDYSPTPKKDPEGRDYVPVYDEPGAAPASAPAPRPRNLARPDRLMRNSRDGLGGIPSPGRAGAPPASARSHPAKVSGEAFGPKGRPFRQRVIAVYRTQPWWDLTPKHGGQHCAPGSRLSCREPGSSEPDLLGTASMDGLWFRVQLPAHRRAPRGTGARSVTSLPAARRRLPLRLRAGSGH